MLLFTPILPPSFLLSSSFPLLTFLPCPNIKVALGICPPLSTLKPEGLLLLSHLFLSLSLTPSIFICRSPFRFLTSSFYLPVVESLPNEVADGSILQRDRVERSPTLKSINLTVSISVQTSLISESKRNELAQELHYCALHLFFPIFCSHLCMKTQAVFYCVLSL